MSSSAVYTMSSKKTAKIEVRAEPEWVERVQIAADKLSLSASAYLRMVATQRMDQDGIPKPHGRKRKSDTD